MQSLAYVAASNGTANASLITVQTVRAPGAATIIVNTVAGAPTKFYGSMGTPHTFTDPVTGETITVISESSAVDFAGSISGGQINIDAIAPGYTDAGSKVGDIIVIRPVTEWANNIFNLMSQSLNDNGSIKNAAVTYNANISDYVVSGGVLAGLGYGSTLTASLSSGSCYINGNLQLIPAVATRTYTANKDTYVDALYNANGTVTIVYTEVANNAASPALAANSIRLGIVVSGANIAAATSIANGNFTNTVPLISGKTLTEGDSLGNTIYPKGVVTPKRITNPYKFKARASTNQALADTVATQLVFGAEDFDTNNNFASNAYTAPVAGFYQINLAVYYTTNKGVAFKLNLRKNGTTLMEVYDSPYPAVTTYGGLSLTYNDIIELAAGDVLTAFGYVDTSDGSNASAVGDPSQSFTYFSGFLVSAS